MTEDHCLGCGTYGPIELHHLAGRHNIPELVIPVCSPCHLILTNWQYAAGIELHADASRTEVDVRRALLVGAMHLIQLIQGRTVTPQVVAPDGLWTLTARAISKVLDLAEPPERAGRWLPDSFVEPHGVTPIAIDPLSEDAQARELGYLLGALLRHLGDMAPLTVEMWNAALADPRTLPERLALVDAGDHAGPSLAMLISQHLDAAHRVMLWLLTLDDWTRVSEQELDEARIWIDTGHRLLAKIAHAAMLPLDGDAA